MQTVFDKIDNFKKSFLGFNPIGALKNVEVWRKYILIASLLALGSWIVFGWESTWMMPFTYVKSVPSLLLGWTTWSEVGVVASSYYGLGQHLSSAVFYGFAFVLISVHLKKHHITKSLNFMASLGLTAMSVGIYELIYNFLYSNCQNQLWTFGLQWRQGFNILTFSGYALIGVLTLVYLISLGYKPNFNRWTKLFVVLSFVTYVLWVFYPLPIQHISVETTSGTWTNTALFPQTMYAVDVDPLDNLATGEAFFVENNVLHLINVLNKLFVTLAILNFVRIKPSRRVT